LTIAFACLQALAVVLWYGWHRFRRAAGLVSGSAAGG